MSSDISLQIFIFVIIYESFPKFYLAEESFSQQTELFIFKTIYLQVFSIILFSATGIEPAFKIKLINQLNILYTF